RLERHIGRHTQANEFDHALGSGELVGRLAARPDLRSAPAACHRRNARAATGQRDFEIDRELCWDDSGQPLDLFGTRNLNLDRKSTRLNSSHGSISYAV